MPGIKSPYKNGMSGHFIMSKRRKKNNNLLTGHWDMIKKWRKKKNGGNHAK